VKEGDKNKKVNLPHMKICYSRSQEGENVRIKAKIEEEKKRASETQDKFENDIEVSKSTIAELVSRIIEGLNGPN
jgi:hypothetical protein